jgi:hypothetical protein
MSQEQRTSPPPDATGMDFSSVEAFRASLAGFYGMCCIPGVFLLRSGSSLTAEL